MAFWEEWKFRQHSLYQYTDTIRGQKLGLRNIDQALDQLNIHKKGFEDLHHEALSERNSAIAISKLNQSINQVNHRINQLLDARNHVLRLIADMEKQVSAKKERIRNLQSSISDDEWNLRQTGMRTSRRMVENIHQRLRSKNNKLRSEQNYLERLEEKLSRLRS